MSRAGNAPARANKRDQMGFFNRGSKPDTSTNGHRPATNGHSADPQSAGETPSAPASDREPAADALRREGRYLIDRDPTAYLEGTVAELIERFTRARSRFRARVAALDHHDLSDRLSYFGRYEATGLELLKTHALHLAGHRFQVRYVRGTFSRAYDTNKADFDPW